MTPKQFKTDILPLPPEILQRNLEITIAVDIMFVNNLPFLVSLSNNIMFTTVEYLHDRKKQSISKALSTINNVYKRRGFKVVQCNMDNEFIPLTGDLMEMGIIINPTSANEHVPSIERRIRVIKERSRSLRHNLPYKHIPKLMIIELVKFTVR